MKFKFRKFTQNNLGGILLNLFLAMGILLLLAVVYFYVYLPNTTNHGETITVPNIEGMQVGELDGFLTKDLRYEVDDSVYSADYPPLTVIKQYPHAGAKVKEGRKIYIAINHLNPPSVPVPNLVDGSVVNADAVLKSNELKRGRIELVSGPFNVVKQMKYQGNNIEPGARVPKGSVIDLVVMDGNIGKGFPIDNLVGQEFEDAKIYLLGVSLNFDVETVGDTTGVTPVILQQKPEAGEKIKVGDVVFIWIGAPGTPLQGDDEELEE